MLLLPGKRARFCFGLPQKLQRIGASLVCFVVSSHSGVDVYLFLGDIIRKGGCFKGVTGEVLFTPKPSY